MSKLPKEGTVRAAVSGFVLEHRRLLAGPVVEIGSRRNPGTWWADLRAQVGFDEVEWVGVDFQPGSFVDVVFDMTSDLSEWPVALFRSSGSARVCVPRFLSTSNTR